MFRLDDEWRSLTDIERQRDEERQRRLERLANPEDLLGPPALLPREPPTLLRELDPQDDPFDLLVDDDPRVTFDDDAAPPVRDLASDFQDEAAVDPRPRQVSPPPGARRSGRVRRPNSRIQGDE